MKRKELRHKRAFVSKVISRICLLAILIGVVFNLLDWMIFGIIGCTVFAINAELLEADDLHD